jgi:hypothetical protein
MKFGGQGPERCETLHLALASPDGPVKGVVPTAATQRGRMKWHGALAQLGERLHGMQEVSGSIPLGSTIS